LGSPDTQPDFRLHLPPEAETRAASLLVARGLASRPFAALFPSTIWQTKHWHVEGFAEIGKHLQRRGLAVVLCGGPGDRERSRRVADACPGAVDLTGETTVGEIAAVARRAELCVTNNSGPMHLAVSLARPVVCVFGPTDPVWIGPDGRPDAVVRDDLPCSPCYLRKVSHCAHARACMTNVTAAMVIDRAEQVLRANGTRCAS
jgi:ADP-heptose:LPS heptosyltransferase